jgi:hypothetical protein
MGSNCVKAETHPQEKFLGTNQQYANLQVELTRVYKKVTGNDLVQGRLRNESGVLDVLNRLEKKVFGVSQQGQNLLQRTERLGQKVDEASKYTLNVSNTSPAASSVVSVSAQLSDAYDAGVATQGVVVTWTSSTNAGTGSFSAPTSVTDNSGVATINFTVDSSANTTHTVTATSGTISGTSDPFTTV